MPKQIDKAVGRRTQAERREESERRMLQAAAELIAEQGFTTTSLDHIGLRAGYRRGLVSHKFGSKEGLAHELIKRIRRNVYDSAIDPVRRKEGGVEAVIEVADAYVAGLERRKPYTRALYVLMFESLGPLPATNEEFKDISRNLKNVFRDLLIDAQKSGELGKHIDCNRLALHITSNLRGITLMWLIEGDEFDLDGARAELRETLSLRLGGDKGSTKRKGERRKATPPKNTGGKPGKSQAKAAVKNRKKV